MKGDVQAQEEGVKAGGWGPEYDRCTIDSTDGNASKHQVQQERQGMSKSVLFPASMLPEC